MAENDVFSLQEQEGNSNKESGNINTVDHFKTMEYAEIVKIIADTLKEFDVESPVHKLFRRYRPIW